MGTYILETKSHLRYLIALNNCVILLVSLNLNGLHISQLYNVNIRLWFLVSNQALIQSKESKTCSKSFQNSHEIIKLWTTIWKPHLADTEICCCFHTPNSMICRTPQLWEVPPYLWIYTLSHLLPSLLLPPLLTSIHKIASQREQLGENTLTCFINIKNNILANKKLFKKLWILLTSLIF